MTHKRYIHQAFTLIEMLIVMTVFLILFGMTIAAFSGLRTSILMNQTTENIKQNFRWTQRAAILLKRAPNENWVYGVGIDLSEFYREGGEYKIFKWCSPFKDYSQDPLAQTQFPNYEENATLDNSGRIPWSSDYLPSGYSTAISGPRYVNECVTSNIGINDSALVEIKSRGVGYVDDFVLPKPLQIGHRTAASPRFIVFESVSGTVFFYDTNGKLMNYTGGSGNYEFVANPVDVDFTIAPPDKSRGINMVVNARSGKMFVNSASRDIIVNNYNFGNLFVEPPVKVTSPATSEPPATTTPPSGDTGDSTPPPNAEEIPGYEGGDREPIELDPNLDPSEPTYPVTPGNPGGGYTIDPIIPPEYAQ